MPDIIHRIGVNVSPKAIYAALTEENGLASWWTRDTKVDPQGKTIQFRFGNGGPDMKVMESTPNEKVQWEVIAGMPEWIGTKIVFTLTPDKQQTFINFKHTNWRTATDTMGHCSMKWAVFLLSLKDYLEKGKGQPYPEDVAIVNERC
jgi:uncharacterized protein YndB with AHSA1/START domain